MKIIEALKELKDQERKRGDLIQRIKENCADTEDMTPTYGDQQANKLREWIQGASDVLKRIMFLKVAIARTNLATQVTIELDGQQVTKSITEWIIRRGVSKKDAGQALQEAEIWKALTDRGLQMKASKDIKDPANPTVFKVRRYFDSAERDKRIDNLSTEKSRIDAALEIKNTVTELIEK